MIIGPSLIRSSEMEMRGFEPFEPFDRFEPFESCGRNGNSGNGRDRSETNDFER